MSPDNTQHIKNINILKKFESENINLQEELLAHIDNIRDDYLFEDLIAELITHEIMDFDDDTITNLLFGVMETLFNALEDCESYK